MQLLTERQLAMRLQVTVDDLNILVDSGRVPYIELGGQIRFDFAEVATAIRRAAQPNMKEKQNAQS